MGKNIDELAKRIAHIKPPNAPKFIGRPYSIGNRAFFMPSSAASTSSTSIERSGVGASEPPCEAKLGREPINFGRAAGLRIYDLTSAPPHPFFAGW
jgi:hypothetical protein